MVKYLFTAIVLKLFSLNRLTRSLYRWLGNRYGQIRRQKLDPTYVERGNWLWGWVERLGIPDHRNIQCLEVGTGWMHFYSIYLRLFMDFKGTVYDVWDNRQLGALKRIFSQVPAAIAPLGLFDSGKQDCAKTIINKICNALNFKQLYEVLSFKYVISPQGSLDMLPSDTYDLVFSVDVLEHVHAGALQQTVSEYFRVLKPGGYSIHQIGVDDHLAHYAKRASKKQYLTYSDFVWNTLFRNDIQYFNRVSYDEFKEIFLAAGFVTIEAFAEREWDSINAIRIAAKYRKQSIESLEATRVFLVYQKPVAV